MASITLVPSGNTGLSGMTISSSYPITNAYKDTSSTSNYARYTINTSTTALVYLTFDTSSIPASATINSVTAKARLRISNASRVTNRICQLYTGTTAKGTSVSFSSTSSGGEVVTLSPGTWTRTELNNLRMKIGGTGSSSSSSKYIYIYGAEVTITYTESNISVTGVSLPSTESVETGSTIQLTETISPSNASNKSVSWSSGNTSVATVNSSGLVTGISAGTAVITVTTADGGYTASCTVTVANAIMYDYVPATSMEVGKKYLIANGNSGSVYLLSNQSGGSRQLVGVAATVSNNRISINGATKSHTEFECVRYTSGNDVTITVRSDNKYLYTDNSTGLRMNAPSTLDRFWHYRDNKFWQFKSTSADGYTDTSTEYKYYLELNSSNNYTDNHVTSPSIENTSLPLIYIYVEDDGSSQTQEQAYFKVNKTWKPISQVYKKINGSWVLQTDLNNLFDSNVNYLYQQ